MVEAILPLELIGATVRKRGKTIVGPIDCRIGETGLSVIMGPNGSGKTTLLRLMHGLERPRSGSIRWNSDTASARKNQAFVFQTPVMLRRTAAENIIYPLRLQGHSKPEAAEITAVWLDRVGLSQASGLGATFLSGGEKQKLALARALSCNPEVLFLDEPTANLDGTATKEIEAILREALASGIRIIMATHDIGQARRLADDIMFLYRGNLHETGQATEFFKKPKTSEARAFVSGDIVE